ncbi:hypothetical protein, partial [Corynebacterium sp. KPL2805]|uniref:hypothetical protein n=1 Tax=Corynebacterium sp. KPL2805 TaxID=3158313 RepID=UPI0032EC513E
MGPLQRLGKALMGAVAVLPVAAILGGVGYWIASVAGQDGPDPQMVDTLKPASRWGSEVPFHHA